ncbi:MAG: D-alanine--D-alanine ligase [Bacteroidetes bacterium]|nr:D-alanine--D-alanine ligase [Bacteroidota bacterium]
MRVGIFFGGASREREVSFAGGRTVYDNLDKSLFEPVPVFIDHFGNFVLLDWQYIYKGSIRDFFPPVNRLPEMPYGFQVYADSLAQTAAESREMLAQIGRPIAAEELPELMDVAFLALHGYRGEDGSIQGLLEWLGIPYTGSGIYPSALGMSKHIQKEQQALNGAYINRFHSFRRKDWLRLDANGKEQLLRSIVDAVGLPFVLKPANQGSSIGVGVVNSNDLHTFEAAVEQALFRMHISAEEWIKHSEAERIEQVRRITDIRSGLGLPLLCNGAEIRLPQELLHQLNSLTERGVAVLLEALQGEPVVLCESFIEGREFSCIVVQPDEGDPIALPPTEIRKGSEVFDYRSKYLPGLSRKITPIDVETPVLEDIRSACTELYRRFHFDVYARIDGFIGNDGKIYLNDPNTTSGMMPSSFFFHQAAEIGLNPSQLLSFILRNSLAACAERWIDGSRARTLLSTLDSALDSAGSREAAKRRIAVVMGGYSFERHISVESGRNIYEKLSSSAEFEPLPVFLASGPDPLELYSLPISSMLKDNADDIREKLRHPQSHPALDSIRKACASITRRYNPVGAVFQPESLSIEQLAQQVEGVFIALHGRPGEDGVIQQQLEAHGLYYNGSGVDSSRITIDKHATNELLMQHGFSVAAHRMIHRDAWENDREAQLSAAAQLHYPLIAKPHDDGCSAAVKKIKDANQLEAYARLMFRQEEALEAAAVKALGLMPKEEFPRKDAFLIESLIDRGEAQLFLEITGGMLTHVQADGSLRYEVFEPSETLAEHGILSLEEKFLAGQGQNITPARYTADASENARISAAVRQTLEAAARVLNISGYCRIDAFVKVYTNKQVEVVFIEVNSLPGMTPATCIYHQAALNGYKPFEFIREILNFGQKYQSGHAQKMGH